MLEVESGLSVSDAFSVLKVNELTFEKDFNLLHSYISIILASRIF